MVHTCCICKGRSVAQGNTSFHSFPTDTSVKQQWIDVVCASGKINFMPSANSRICSEHFLSDKVLKHFGRIALKHGSVPCIRVAANANISTPKRKKKGLSKRRLQFTPVSPMPSTSCEDINSGFAHTVRISESASVAKSFSKRKVPVYFGDINPKDLKTPKLLQVWQIANKTITKTRRRN